MVEDDRDIDIETDGDDIEMNGSVRRVGIINDTLNHKTMIGISMWYCKIHFRDCGCSFLH